MVKKMIQTTTIQDWCATNGFNFCNCDVEGIKVPCSLDKKYKTEDMTVFISGFFPGSKKIMLSWGGLKQELTLKRPIDLIPCEHVLQQFVPQHFICPRCNQKNLNLSTDDGHKTYVCPECYGKPKPATRISTLTDNKHKEAESRIQ